MSRLSGGKVPSKSEMDTAEANLKRAVANEANANASVTQAKAALQSNETDLTKASIRSPINGVVLNREVGTGTDGGRLLSGAGTVYPGGRPV